mgnify:CR=1 FL=1
MTLQRFRVAAVQMVSAPELAPNLEAAGRLDRVAERMAEVEGDPAARRAGRVVYLELVVLVLSLLSLGALSVELLLPLDPELRRAFEVSLEIQEAVRQAMVPGAIGEEIYRQAAEMAEAAAVAVAGGDAGRAHRAAVVAAFETDELLFAGVSCVAPSVKTHFECDLDRRTGDSGEEPEHERVFAPRSRVDHRCGEQDDRTDQADRCNGDRADARPL